MKLQSLGSALGLALASAWFVATPAVAVPPGAMVGSSLRADKWVEHRVLPGDRLKEIAERYAVSVRSLIRWNKLDPERPRLRAGSRLRVKTPLDVPKQVRKRYRVRKGDNWSRIAKKHGVSVTHLQKRWNPTVDALRPGDRISIWIDEEPEPEPEPVLEELAPEEAPKVAGLTVVPVSPSSRSVGRPGRGRIRKSKQLPQNPALYTIRNPGHAHATSHTIMNLQTAVANWRARTGFSRELMILDISRRNGGRLRPHRSHRSGRDVDIRLPLAPGVPEGTVPLHPDEVDWDMTWALIQSLIDTDQVVYIFLSRSRQRYLHAAAERAGVSAADLEKHIQYPGRARLQTVRHAAGHEKHIHVRFKCAPDSERCRD